jgi:catechol-2,3-dioxygenase
MSQIDTVFLPVRSIEKTTRWYQEKLGWLMEWKNIEVASFKPVTEITFNLYTQNIQTASEMLKKNGVEVSEILDYGNAQYFYFKDLDGNLISVSSW